MHPALKASLTQLVTIKKHTSFNAYGEPTITVIGPVRGRFETNRTRVYTPEGDQVTLEGMLFIDGPDLAIGMVEAGDVVVHGDTGKERAIRVIEPLYDLDSPEVDHWEISF